LKTPAARGALASANELNNLQSCALFDPDRSPPGAADNGFVEFHRNAPRVQSKDAQKFKYRETARDRPSISIYYNFNRF
jgi:hypothetical protein